MKYAIRTMLTAVLLFMSVIILKNQSFALPQGEITAPNVSVRDKGMSYIVVDWPSVSQATGYYVEFATDKYFNSTLISREQSGTSCAFEGLTPGRSYYVKVSSFNSNSDSESKELCIKTDYGAMKSALVESINRKVNSGKDAYVKISGASLTTLEAAYYEAITNNYQYAYAKDELFLRGLRDPYTSNYGVWIVGSELSEVKMHSSYNKSKALAWVKSSNATTSSRKTNIIRIEKYLRKKLSYDHGSKIYYGYQTLKTRKGICQSYAEIFRNMCQIRGIPCYTLFGRNHAWNRVKYGGKWYYADASFYDTSGGSKKYLPTKTLWKNHHIDYVNK